MTPAERAAEKIVNAICDNRKSWTIAQFAAIITAEMGDGEDKERLDWAMLNPERFRYIFQHYKLHERRSAIDAERKKAAIEKK